MRKLCDPRRGEKPRNLSVRLSLEAPQPEPFPSPPDSRDWGPPRAPSRPPHPSRRSQRPRGFPSQASRAEPQPEPTPQQAGAGLGLRACPRGRDGPRPHLRGILVCPVPPPPPSARPGAPPPSRPAHHREPGGCPVPCRAAGPRSSLGETGKCCKASGRPAPSVPACPAAARRPPPAARRGTPRCAHPSARRPPGPLQPRALPRPPGARASAAGATGGCPAPRPAASHIRPTQIAFVPGRNEGVKGPRGGGYKPISV